MRSNIVFTLISEISFAVLLNKRRKSRPAVVLLGCWAAGCPQIVTELPPAVSPTRLLLASLTWWQQNLDCESGVSADMQSQATSLQVFVLRRFSGWIDRKRPMLLSPRCFHCHCSLLLDLILLRCRAGGAEARNGCPAYSIATAEHVAGPLVANLENI